MSAKTYYTLVLKSVLGPVHFRPCYYLIGKGELFQNSLIGFQKFILFWVARIILEARDVELERAYSFMFQFCLLAVCWIHKLLHVSKTVLSRRALIPANLFSLRYCHSVSYF